MSDDQKRPLDQQVIELMRREVEKAAADYRGWIPNIPITKIVGIFDALREIGFGVVRLDPHPVASHTQRGFALVEFKDQRGIECSLQKSSIATDDCVWLGSDDIGLRRFEPGLGWSDVDLPSDPRGRSYVANNRMHLNREQVSMLLPYLHRFVETGEIDAPEAERVA